MEKFINSTKEHFKTMCSSGKLFRANISGREIYQFYLMAFPDGENPIFRDPASSTHNCNTCNNFIRRYGNIVSIGKKGELITIFGGTNIPEPHKTVAEQLDTLIKSRSIESVFFETFDELNSLNYEKCNKKQETFRLGVPGNLKKYTKEEAEKFGIVNTTDIYEFNHLHLDLPKIFVNQGGKSIESIIGDYREKYNVFKRLMEEISAEVLTLAKDLIVQGSLLDGATHLHAVKEIIPLKAEYDAISTSKENWLWDSIHSMEVRTAKFGNTLVGEFCYELAEGIELEKACLNFNKRVDPANYMKATAPITKKQIEEAQKFVVENGYLESFDRRLATIDDINVSEIKHISTSSKVKAATIFDSVKPTASSKVVPKFDTIEEIPIEKFMTDILPGCTSVEALFQGRLEGNLVTLTTTKNEASKDIFKWPNNFSWTFNGNLAGKSQIKEAVISRGGRVDGVFRFSHSWNNIGRNQSLMDLHVFLPGAVYPPGNIHNTYPNSPRVGWNNRKDPKSGGTQDVDYVTQAPPGYIPVENITFPDLKKMPHGKYVCRIHNWSLRGITDSGGTAEIEFGGNLYEYEYPKLGNHEWVTVAEVTLDKNGFTIDHKLPCKGETSKEIWGLKTNSFHKVNLISLSPNHWGENAVGNKHYFFMLEDAKTNQEVRGFHNENLLPELLAHRKVMEVLANKSLIAPSDKQLSGLGFNSTVKDELVVKLTGSFNRMVKIKF